jgi:RND family efflux transporter MFP subunit
VIVQEMKKIKVKHSFHSIGTVKAQNIAFISPELNGQIKKIFVKEGQNVVKGQKLLALNSDIILSSISELKTALSLAGTMYEKQKSLWNKGIGKEVDYLRAKNQKESLEAKLRTLRAQYKMSKIDAPFSGIVDRIYSKVGEMAGPGRQIIDLVNLNTMEVEIDISEKYLPYIKTGDSLSVRFPTYAGMLKKATVDRIGNIINRANRTIKVVVKVDNKDQKIKPNMIAEVLLSDYEGEDILVPSIIVKNDRKGKYIYIAKQENDKILAEKRYVITGKHIEDNTVISKGVIEGEKVITAGYNLVSTGVVVTVQQ